MPHKVTQAGINEILKILEEMPVFLKGLSEKYSEDQLAAAEPREWSAIQILAHIRTCADVWSNSIYAMIMLDNPALAFIHPRDWDKKQKYKTLSFEENLLAYSVNRTNLLRMLASLKFEDWDRTATFTGKKNVYTLYGQAHRMASHDADHRQQLEGMFT